MLKLALVDILAPTFLVELTEGRSDGELLIVVAWVAMWITHRSFARFEMTWKTLHTPRRAVYRVFQRCPSDSTQPWLLRVVILLLATRPSLPSFCHNAKAKPSLVLPLCGLERRSCKTVVSSTVFSISFHRQRPQVECAVAFVARLYHKEQLVVKLAAYFVRQYYVLSFKALQSTRASCPHQKNNRVVEHLLLCSRRRSCTYTHLLHAHFSGVHTLCAHTHVSCVHIHAWLKLFAVRMSSLPSSCLLRSHHSPIFLAVPARSLRDQSRLRPHRRTRPHDPAELSRPQSAGQAHSGRG